MLQLINLPQKTQEAVPNFEIIVTKWKQLDKSNVPSIKYPYYAKLFKFFIKSLQKSSDLLLLDMTSIILVLRLVKSKKKLLCKKLLIQNILLRINFCPQSQNFAHFSNPSFLIIRHYKWNQRTNCLKIGSYSMFPIVFYLIRFGFVSFVFILDIDFCYKIWC